MSEDRSDEDSILDVWYANFEQQCTQALDGESDLESQLQVHRDFYAQQIWASFHTGATAIAQLYKGGVYSTLFFPFYLIYYSYSSNIISEVNFFCVLSVLCHLDKFCLCLCWQRCSMTLFGENVLSLYP